MEYKENNLTIDSYCALRESVGWNNFCVEQIKEVLKNSIYDIVASEEENAVGMGRLIGDGLYYTIVDIVVAPKFQGKGIGTSIVNHIMNYIVENIPKGGRVSVQLISEKGKEPFYEKLGFETIPNDNCGSGMKKIINNN
jgi:GNAT superfamily N-acetyltransferase